MKNIRIRVGFFSLLIVLTTVFTKNVYAIFTILAVSIHESGHIVAAILLGINISEFNLSILGARLKTEARLTSYLQEIFLCIFGPLFNLLSAGIALIIFDFEEVSFFVASSILLAVLNLLPIKSFDGGRIFECLLSLFFPPKYVDVILKSVSFFFVLSLWLISVYFLLIYTSSLGLFVFSVSLFCNIFVEDNF